MTRPVLISDRPSLRPSSSSATTTPQSIPHIANTSSTGPRLPGKIIIITGCNSPTGIGRASAHQFAQNGAAALFLCDYIASNLDAHVAELGKLYPSVEVHGRQFDAADEQAVRRVVDEAVRRYGRLDVMFANAGVVGTNRPLGQIEGEEFMETMRVNALSVFLAIREAARVMRVDGCDRSAGRHQKGEDGRDGRTRGVSGGSIIATSSVAGLRSGAGSTDYSASKAAVRSLVQTSAWQLAGTGIRVNAILPGLVETGMTSVVYEMARQRGTEWKIGQLNPTRRGGVADEVARVALFLASDEASYVNGQAWAVDGGLSAGHPVVPGKLA